MITTSNISSIILKYALTGPLLALLSLGACGEKSSNSSRSQDDRKLCVEIDQVVHQLVNKLRDDPSDTNFDSLDKSLGYAIQVCEPACVGDNDLPSCERLENAVVVKCGSKVDCEAMCQAGNEKTKQMACNALRELHAAP